MVLFKHEVIRTLFWIQGSIYALTGTWALVHLPSFFWITQNASDPFKTQANGVLFLAIGLFAIYKAYLKHITRIECIFLGSTCIGIALVDLWYLLHYATSWPFWFDAIEELCVGATLLVISRGKI